MKNNLIKIIVAGLIILVAVVGSGALIRGVNSREAGLLKHQCRVREDGFIEWWSIHEEPDASAGVLRLWNTCGVREDGFIEWWSVRQEIARANAFRLERTCGVREDGFIEWWANYRAIAS